MIILNDNYDDDDKDDENEDNHYMNPQVSLHICIKFF